jgi:predicted nucleotidyltransferase component of viral defense system
MAKEIITPYQKKVIKKISEDRFIKENFYLTGGTALAGFYLFHRYSEDLDFFSENEFDVSAIDVFFKKNKKSLGITKIDFQQSYNRNLFFIYRGKNILKTEFTYFPFPPAGKSKSALGIKIDNIQDIAVNKLFSIYQRSVARDYIDLYFIIKKYKYNIGNLIKKAKLKFDWHIDYLQLGTQFIKAQDASDYPRMIKKINHKDWKNFFTAEAEKFRKNIVKV